jgi:hypothetical protein
MKAALANESDVFVPGSETPSCRLSRRRADDLKEGEDLDQDDVYDREWLAVPRLRILSCGAGYRRA